MSDLAGMSNSLVKAEQEMWSEGKHWIFICVGSGMVPHVSAVSVVETADTLATTLSCSFRIFFHFQPKNFQGKSVGFSTHFLNELNEMLQVARSVFPNIPITSLIYIGGVWSGSVCVTWRAVPQDAAANAQDCGYWKWAVFWQIQGKLLLFSLPLFNSLSTGPFPFIVL